jgi:hypothetical protein
MANLICTAKITRDGGQEILEKGFCYSKTESFPTKNNSDYVIVSTPIDENGIYSTIITELDPDQYYYISSYAINDSGIDYSDATMGETTKPVAILPTLTIYILKNGLNTSIVEMGTSNSLVVSGETTKNDETIFNNLQLHQTSVPPVTNPIKTWNGFIYKYSTTNNPPVNINFSPMGNIESSWIMTQESRYNCGLVPYVISTSQTIEGVFPFLWILKNSQIINPLYYNPETPTTSYFYYESSNNPGNYNGKTITTKPDKNIPMIFVMMPNATLKYLHLGYPSYYGDIQYSLDNLSWIDPGTTLKNTIVSSGPYGNNFGIQNSWSRDYKILGYTFTTPSSFPINFYIRFKS